MSQFKADDTKKDNFYVSRDKISKAQFMEQKGKFNYYTSEELRAHVLEMPYQGEEVSWQINCYTFSVVQVDDIGGDVVVAYDATVVAANAAPVVVVADDLLLLLLLLSLLHLLKFLPALLLRL